MEGSMETLLTSLTKYIIRHRLATIVLWIILLIAAIVFGGNISSSLESGTFQSKNTESARASQLIEKYFRVRSSNNLIVVFQSNDGQNIDSPGFQKEVARSLERIAAVAPPHEALTYYNTGNRDFIGMHGDSTYALLSFKDPENQLDLGKFIEPIRNAAKKDSTLDVSVTGAQAIDFDLEELSKKDLVTTEVRSAPLILIILLMAFGGAVAVFLPIILAISAILLTTGLLAALLIVQDLSIFTLNTATMIGLGIAIDYALLIGHRFREELKNQKTPNEALVKTMSSAGETVLFAGTVLTISALATLFFDNMLIRSLGIGIATVAFASICVSLTLLPAILSYLGTNINRFKVPFLTNRVKHEEGFFERMARPILKRPLLYLAGVLTLLFVLASFAFSIRLGFSGFEALPPENESHHALSILDKEFGPGETSPIYVFLESSSSEQPYAEDISLAFQNDPRVKRSSLARHPVYPVSLMTIIPTKAANDPQTIELVKDIRIHPMEGTVTKVVGGQTAAEEDFIKTTWEKFTLLLLILLPTAFIVLMFLFRSLVLPFKAIVVNLISTASAYGILVLLFQHGIGGHLLGIHQTGFINAVVPTILFVVLFGLTMDYEVFILSRIKEQYLLHRDNDRAIREGIGRTGSIVSFAALIMIVVFGAFGFGQIVIVKQIGIGLAIAMLLDATLIRLILIPASMKIMGRWNWWMPFRKQS
jgi:RND superfamily putative drug exporter